MVVGGYPIPVHSSQQMAVLALAMLNKQNSFWKIINQSNTPNLNHQQAVRFSVTNIVLIS